MLQHPNMKKGHVHDVQVKHEKIGTLSYLQKSLEHAQKGMGILQIITDSQTWQKSLDKAEITSGCKV